MWGRKKFSPSSSNSPPSSTSSRASSSSISSAFPSSWISWFKSIKRRPDLDARMADDDGSFCKGLHDAGKTSFLYNSVDHLHSKSTVSDRRKITEEFDVLRGNDELKVFKERPGEEELAEFEPIRLNRSSRRQRSISFPTPNTRITGVVEEGSNAASEKRRRRRDRRRRRKSAAGSPRTWSSPKHECRIKALEEMKRARMKIRERRSMDRVCFDSYAIVKSSVDPRSDFRESMVEMITAKDIRQPEELEELLACYLTLNCDEHHDIIVKVFRQVWFDLNQLHFYPDL